MKFWNFFYNLFVLPLLWIFFHVGRFVNEKIRRGVTGRKNLLNNLAIGVRPLSNTWILWFHASSLGEFEQAKPIISAIRKLYPKISILATFFSPSGYENSRNYKHADFISYIPFDSVSNAKSFIEIVQPRAAIMVRYDIWPNMIWELHKKKIPVFIANATMPTNSPRKLPLIKNFHKHLYNEFSHILTVTHNDLVSFKDFEISKPILSAIGDTRFDQVMSRNIDAQNKHFLSESIIENKKIFIVGQSWEEDEEVILPALLKLNAYDENLLTIIVPHEPTIDHLEQLEFHLENKISYIRFSEMNDYKNEKVILVDSVGILFALYKYAHIVYVGGSFKQGIHNVLEPAVFGVPIIFGPKHLNSQEAIELAKRGGAFQINDESELFDLLKQMLNNPSYCKQTGLISESFVREHCGATDRFIKYLEPYLS